MGRIVLLLAAGLLGLTACGAGNRPKAQPQPRSQQCRNQAAALAKIHRDVGALAAAAKLPTRNELLGNHPINVATDRFLNDVELAPITNLQRNRLIDLAASAIGTRCQQCFQALEAERPIPAIRAGDLKCSG